MLCVEIVACGRVFDDALPAQGDFVGEKVLQLSTGDVFEWNGAMWVALGLTDFFFLDSQNCMLYEIVNNVPSSVAFEAGQAVVDTLGGVWYTAVDESTLQVKFTFEMSEAGCSEFGLCNDTTDIADNHEIVQYSVPCYVNSGLVGAPTASVVRIPYSSTLTLAENVEIRTLATQDEVGAIYGLAYTPFGNPSQFTNAEQGDNLFMAAFLKRWNVVGTTPFDASQSIGSIFRCRNTLSQLSRNPELFVDFNNLTNFGPLDSPGDPAVYGSAARGAGVLDPGNDQDLLGMADSMKVGFGDIEISSDYENLFVVNLNNRTLYRLPIGAGTTPQNYMNGDARAASIQRRDLVGAAFVPLYAHGVGLPRNIDNIRPFGLGVKNGYIYIGVVDTDQFDAADVQTGGMSQNLHAFVIRLPEADIASGTPELVLDFSLFYLRRRYFGGDMTGNASNNGSVWQPWVDNMVGSAFVTLPDTPGREITNYPQPILSDLAFDDDCNMYIGLRDRTADWGGVDFRSEDAGDPILYTTESSAGDILKATSACALGTGAPEWTLEPLATALPPPPGNPTPLSFFDDVSPVGVSAQREATQGALAYFPTRNEILTTVTDPIGLESGGTARFSTLTGKSRLPQTEVYNFSNNPQVGKSNGLGDLELMLIAPNPPCCLYVPRACLLFQEIGDPLLIVQAENNNQSGSYNVCYVSEKGTDVPLLAAPVAYGSTVSTTVPVASDDDRVLIKVKDAQNARCQTQFWLSIQNAQCCV